MFGLTHFSKLKTEWIWCCNMPQMKFMKWIEVLDLDVIAFIMTDISI